MIAQKLIKNTTLLLRETEHVFSAYPKKKGLEL
jgi:hypothetical protein